MVQQQNNSSSWHLQGGTPNRGIPGIYIPQHHIDEGIVSLGALKCNLLHERWAVALFSDYVAK